MDTSQDKGCIHYDFLSTSMGYDGAKRSYHIHTAGKGQCQQLHHQKIKSRWICIYQYIRCTLQDFELLCRRDSKIYTRWRISDDCRSYRWLPLFLFARQQQHILRRRRGIAAVLKVLYFLRFTDKWGIEASNFNLAKKKKHPGRQKEYSSFCPPRCLINHRMEWDSHPGV